jgi:ubiquinone/menaquinone biosynthesis C-methylase UbiE
MNLSTVQKKLFAWGMAQVNQANAREIKIYGLPQYSNFAQLKQDLLGSIEGKVLEIGPGAGINLSYYPKNIHWLGIEPNIFMFPYLEAELEKQGITDFTLRVGEAENLPVEADSMDVVVSTHVLCSVKDVARSLAEIYRVLKPGGKFIFLEHIAAPSPSRQRYLQNAVKPIWQILFDNCHPNRETDKLLEQAGFANLDSQHFTLDFPVVSPHIFGVGQKKEESCLDSPHLKLRFRHFLGFYFVRGK